MAANFLMENAMESASLENERLRTSPGHPPQKVSSIFDTHTHQKCMHLRCCMAGIGGGTLYTKLRSQEAKSMFKFKFRSTLEIRDTWISPRTRVSPSLILRSKKLIPRSTRERLSFITFSYGPIQELEKHGIVRGE